ncbi:MAG: ATP-binding protein [Vampirovibrionales bacterium]|nr:ATP-binding protein [Vampirovibrionales bacterium]
MLPLRLFFDADYPPPIFIQADLLERLGAGAFVPQRVRQVLEGTVNSSERRQANARRYPMRQRLLYEPRVFENRLSEIMRLASLLNASETRVIFISGPPGSGKTTLLRGLIELFGGGSEHLIWLSPTLLDDSESLCENILWQLVLAITEHVHADLNDALSGVNLSDFIDEAPRRRHVLLDKILGVLAEKQVALCVIVDSVSVLLDKQDRLADKCVDLFNHLLNYPNLKLIFSGHHVPLGSLHPSSTLGLCHLVLPPLSLAFWRTLLPPPCRSSLMLSTASSAVAYPWLAAWLSRLYHCILDNKTLLESALFTPSSDQAFQALFLEIVNKGLFSELSLAKELQNKWLPFWWKLWQAFVANQTPLMSNLLWILLCVRHPLSPRMMSQMLTFVSDGAPSETWHADPLCEGEEGDSVSAFLQEKTPLGCLLLRQGTFYWISPVLKAPLSAYLLTMHWSQMSRMHAALGRFYATQRFTPSDVEPFFYSPQRLKRERDFHAQKTGDPRTLHHLMAHRQKTGFMVPEDSLMSENWLQWPIFPARLPVNVSDNLSQQPAVVAWPEQIIPEARHSGVETNAAASLSENIFTEALPNTDIETLVESYLAEGHWRSAAYALAMAAQEAEQKGDVQDAMEWYWQQGNVLWLEGNQPSAARQAYQSAYRLGKQTFQPERVMAILQERLAALGASGN